MSSWPILSLVTFLPLVGALFCLVVQGPKEAVDRNCRSAALLTSLATFLISLLLWVRFDSTKAGFQFEEKLAWVPELNIGYHMGIDGISLFFVLLSTLLTPICVLASWESVQTRVKEYMVAFLVLETFMVGMFCALDLALFYVFFEGVLIPMFLIIGVWGGKRRVYAAFKFFLYTLLGSVLMLLAILVIYFIVGTTDIPPALGHKFDLNLQTWLWLAFFASFAVKVPMWPVHTWLPDAHVEAPTAGSVMLALKAMDAGCQMVRVHASLKAMSQGLGDKPFCSGTHFSLADVSAGCALGYLDFRFPEIDWRADHPNLLKLAEKLAQRQSFIDTAPPQS